MDAERQEDLNLEIDKLSDEEKEIDNEDLIDAAELFYDALIEIDVDEDSAEAARTAFIALEIT